MGKREKRLIKQIESLKAQAEKHREKIKVEKGKKDTTPEYWKTEAEEYERQAKEKEEILKRLRKTKR